MAVDSQGETLLTGSNQRQQSDAADAVIAAEAYAFLTSDGGRSLPAAGLMTNLGANATTAQRLRCSASLAPPTLAWLDLKKEKPDSYLPGLHVLRDAIAEAHLPVTTLRDGDGKQVGPASNIRALHRVFGVYLLPHDTKRRSVFFRSWMGIQRNLEKEAAKRAADLEEEERHCTFHPQLTAESLEMAQRNKKDFFQFGREWLKIHERKLAAVRRKEAEERVAEEQEAQRKWTMSEGSRQCLTHAAERRDLFALLGMPVPSPHRPLKPPPRFSFSPEIHQHSKVLAQKVHEGASFLRRIKADASLKEQQRLAAEAEAFANAAPIMSAEEIEQVVSRLRGGSTAVPPRRRSDGPDDELTFRPKINPLPPRGPNDEWIRVTPRRCRPSGGGAEPTDSSPLLPEMSAPPPLSSQRLQSFLQRSADWVEGRSRQTSELQSARKTVETAECTFSPKITPYASLGEASWAATPPRRAPQSPSRTPTRQLGFKIVPYSPSTPRRHLAVGERERPASDPEFVMALKEWFSRLDTEGSGWVPQQVALEAILLLGERLGVTPDWVALDQEFSHYIQFCDFVYLVSRALPL